MMYTILIVVFIAIMPVYFRIACHYNIIDKPNDRSSHQVVTVRGGGVIFLLAAIIAMVIQPAYWLPLSGVLVIGLISFIDDIVSLSGTKRILVHFIAVTIMFFFLHLFSTEPIYYLIFFYLMVIGIINMYNFMDGINGITGLYSLVILVALQYINLCKNQFIAVDLIWLPIMACIVFLFFNFRTKAKCFAGDVGSVTIAFWIVLLLLRLILITNNWTYILFLVVYGVDSSLTILHRLILKQNIFEAHRFHFYQLLVNEYKLPHLLVATSYTVIQLCIILLIVFNTTLSRNIVFGLSIIPLAVLYILSKPFLTKIKRTI